MNLQDQYSSNLTISALRFFKKLSFKKSIYNDKSMLTGKGCLRRYFLGDAVGKFASQHFYTVLIRWWIMVMDRFYFGV